MDNIKVIYVAGRVDTRSGAFHSMLSNLKELRSRNVTPIVIIHKHGDTEQELNLAGIKNYVVPYCGCTVPYDNPSYLKGMYKTIVNFILEYRIKKIIELEKPDVVHINVGSTSIGAKSAIKYGVPLVWHLREFLEEDVNLTYINPQKTVNLMMSAEKIVAISDAVSNHFKQKYGLKNIVTVYNGIMYDELVPVKSYISQDEIRMSIVGRIVPGKGQLDAVKALNILLEKGYKNFRLNIVGDCGDEKYFQKIIQYIEKAKLGDYISVISHQRNLTEIWKKTDIAIMCSTKEGFGRVTAEFMLNGVPVIGSDTGATPELLGSGRGYIYEYSNIEELVDKILYAVSNPLETKKRAEKAQKYAAAEFSSSNCSNRILNIYKELV